MQKDGKPRAVVRKLGQRDGQACGDANQVTGGMPPTGNGRQQAGGPEGGGEQPASRTRLAEASAEVLTALRAAKEELARELEANLKQLKSVLEETQRIQKEMEAVLKETQCAPSLQEQARGKGGPPREKKAARGDQQQTQQGEQGLQGQSVQQGQQVPPWEQLQLHPGEPPSWEPPDLNQPQGDGALPAWQPPPEASRPQPGQQ